MLQLCKRALRLLFYCCQIRFCLCFGRFQFLLCLFLHRDDELIRLPAHCRHILPGMTQSGLSCQLSLVQLLLQRLLLTLFILQLGLHRIELRLQHI